MAELVGGAFLSSFFDAIFGRLASVDFKEYFRRGKLDTLVDKLEVTLNSINQVLDVAEKKQYQIPEVKKWLADVKHAAYEADQLLDEIAIDQPLKKLKAESQPAATSGNLSGLFPAITKYPFESRIKELLNNLDFLAEQKDKLGLEQGTCARNEVGKIWKPSKRLSPTSRSDRKPSKSLATTFRKEVGVSWKHSERLPSTSLVDESSIYGRDGDKEELIKFLLSDNQSSNQVPVISIVGLGGVGKTTLAQLVYNDHRMQYHFELKAWVHVSESCDVIGLTKSIMRSFYSSAEGEDLNLLQVQLQLTLTSKRYLLVLDDVWNMNGERWELLLLPLNHRFSRSKIVVTTRDKAVASVMKSTHLLHLKQLEESHCWSLFVRHAFHGRNVSEYPNLQSIGKNIVDKCGGLPLAVKTLGDLLGRKFSQREWVKILETDMWRILEGDSQINSVLRLSYHNLPSNLKRCFAYCSMFPRGYKFRKGELIKLWMAEGLLDCRGTGKSEEELGNEFFNNLESISFFQQSVDSTGLKDFTMHELVIGLAKSVSEELCLQIEGDRVQDIPKRTRHIWCSLDLKDGDRKLEHIYKIEGLRSLMVQEQGSGDQRFKIYNNVQLDLFSRLKCLRMLSLSHCSLSWLTDEISNLKLLQYLDLSFTEITSLPDSICELSKLQTLLLRNCHLTELPSDFYKLVNLCHLNLQDTDIKKMPKHIGRLNNLQMLTNFVVGEQSGSDIKELAKLDHLQETLTISGLENVIDPADAMTTNLKGKKHLEELCMMYSIIEEIDGSKIEMHAFVLEALLPNSNLNRLTIEYYQGTTFPNWLGDCHLPNLVSLALSKCTLCSQFPPLGQLPSLKELYIQRCCGIEIIGEEFYGNNSSTVPFRSLEILQFRYMYEWKEWLCVEGCFPLLKKLTVHCCRKLKGPLPQHLPSLEELTITDCGNLKASIPNVDNISNLELKGCENILVNELPYSLKSVTLGGTWFIESSLEQILFNNVCIENLDLDFSGSMKCSSLNLHCCYSLHNLYIRGWGYSSLPFALHLFINLHSLKLYDCPQLESFPGGGLPSNLGSLEIHNCPKLIASREEWVLFELNSLKEFSVSDEFENVESFPEECVLPPTLNILKLSNCSKLRIMNYKGLLHLKSLKTLWIDSCSCLERLPEEGLPNSLSDLSITHCSLLTQLYKKEEGERWHKICHIPFVTII